MPKKIKNIGFTDEVIEIVERYQEKWGGTNFTRTVLKIIKKYDQQRSTPDFNADEFNERLLEMEKNYSYFMADETQSQVGNIEFKLKEYAEQFEEIEKKLKVLIASSKLFKAHLNDREIHMK